MVSNLSGKSKPPVRQTEAGEHRQGRALDRDAAWKMPGRGLVPALGRARPARSHCGRGGSIGPLSPHRPEAFLASRRPSAAYVGLHRLTRQSNERSARFLGELPERCQLRRAPRSAEPIAQGGRIKDGRARVCGEGRSPPDEGPRGRGPVSAFDEKRCHEKRCQTPILVNLSLVVKVQRSFHRQ